MKKLLSVLAVAGLLGFSVGCETSTSTPPKGTGGAAPVEGDKGMGEGDKGMGEGDKGMGEGEGDK